MKSLKNIILEKLSSSAKYTIEYKKNGERKEIESQNYKSDLQKILSSGYNPKKDYYIVFNNNSDNFSDINSVVEFGGTGSDFQQMMDRYERGERSTIYTNLSKSQYELLKSKYKD